MKLKNKKKILIPLAVATMTIGASMTSFAAYGWQNADGTWHYYDSDGNLATESWKKSGNNWYWLDENGDMATDTLVEVDDEHYYVDENGVQVKNQWRELDNDDDSEDASDTAWYYFGPNGKAYKAGDSGKTTFKSIVTASGATKKYAFDDQGRMLYGWVNESSERQTGDDRGKRVSTISEMPVMVRSEITSGRRLMLSMTSRRMMISRIITGSTLRATVRRLWTRRRKSMERSTASQRTEMQSSTGMQPRLRRLRHRQATCFTVSRRIAG